MPIKLESHLRSRATVDDRALPSHANPINQGTPVEKINEADVYQKVVAQNPYADAITEGDSWELTQQTFGDRRSNRSAKVPPPPGAVRYA